MGRQACRPVPFCSVSLKCSYDRKSPIIAGCRCLALREHPTGGGLISNQIYICRLLQAAAVAAVPLRPAAVADQLRPLRPGALAGLRQGQQGAWGRSSLP